MRGSHCLSRHLEDLFERRQNDRWSLILRTGYLLLALQILTRWFRISIYGAIGRVCPSRQDGRTFPMDLYTRTAISTKSSSIDWSVDTSYPSQEHINMLECIFESYHLSDQAPSRSSAEKMLYNYANLANAPEALKRLTPTCIFLLPQAILRH